MRFSLTNEKRYVNSRSLIKMADVLVAKYIEYLSTRQNASPSTIRNYNYYLREFADRHDVVNITVEKIDQFHGYLIRERNLGIKTQAYYLIALRSFYKFLEIYDYAKFNYKKIIVPKYRKDDKIDFLNREEIQRLLDCIKPKTIIEYRNKAILYMFWSTGMRVGELCKLNCTDVDFVEKEFKIVGKGAKSRVVFLTEEAAYWIWQYNKRRKDKLLPMFINYRNKRHREDISEQRRLSEVSVEKIIKVTAKKAGIERDIDCHILRHSFATNLVKNGADIRSVQLLMGHSNIQTTQIYLHFTDNELKQVHSRCL